MSDINDLFHHELLTLQRRMRRLRNTAPSPIDPKVSLVLPTLACHPTLNFTELSRYLKMDTGNFSRLMQQMRKSHYIEILTDEADRRQRIIAFTPLGKLVMEEAVSSWQRNAEIGLGPLTKEERDKIGEYFTIVSDGLGAPRVKQLPNEELFVREQKRISQASGMLGSDYMASGLDIYTYQLLYNVLHRSLVSDSECIRFRDLTKMFPLNPSSVSRLVDRLVEEHTLSKLSEANDKRGILVTFTESGKKYFAETHRATTERLANATRELTTAQIEELVALLKLGNTSTNTTSISCKSPFSFTACETEEQLRQARAFYVEELVKQSAHHNLPEIILPQGFIYYLATASNKLVGLATFTKSDTDNTHLRLTELLLASSITRKNKRREFLSSLISTTLKHHMTNIEIVPKLAARYRDDWLALGASRTASKHGLTFS